MSVGWAASWSRWRPISNYKRRCAAGFHSIENHPISSFLHKSSLLSNYSLSSLIRISPKIVRTSLILRQGPSKRFKEDKETRKVEIGRLGGEEEGLEVLLSKKILRVKILEEESS